MPNIRYILNKIKWTKDLHDVEIWYVHRGVVNNTKCIVGDDIINIGRSFLETNTTAIPYHRVIKVLYKDKTVFDRGQVHNKHKQL
jgi:uncharacterized protein (UPF0248 family)